MDGEYREACRQTGVRSVRSTARGVGLGETIPAGIGIVTHRAAILADLAARVYVDW